MLNNEFKKSAIEKVTAMSANELKEAFKSIGSLKTNEEWLRGATFEELAGAIYEWYSLGYTRGKNGKKLNSITEVVEWLKEEHDGSV